MVSATTYVACGSSDDTKSDHEAGAGGEGGGEPNSSGGSKNTAGSSNVAGSKNGGGGDTGSAGAPGGAGGDGGVAGAAVGGAGGGGDEPVGGEAGAGGAGGSMMGTGFPPACPGVIGDYTLAEGTGQADTFTTAQLSGQIFARGKEGDDVFEAETGQDCLAGGPGDDDFYSASENASYFVGGPGLDSFHLAVGSNNYTRIGDMTAADTIGLSKATFAFLAGNVGATPLESQVYTIADYEAGTGTIPPAESAAIVYDPATGGLWLDSDRGTNMSGASQIATIVNAGSYTYDINDFVLDD